MDLINHTYASQGLYEIEVRTTSFYNFPYLTHYGHSFVLNILILRAKSIAESQVTVANTECRRSLRPNFLEDDGFGLLVKTIRHLNQ